MDVGLNSGDYGKMSIGQKGTLTLPALRLGPSRGGGVGTAPAW